MMDSEFDGEPAGTVDTINGEKIIKGDDGVWRPFIGGEHGLKKIGFGNTDAESVSSPRGESTRTPQPQVKCTAKLDCICDKCMVEFDRVQKKASGGKGYTHAIGCNCKRCRWEAALRDQKRSAAGVAGHAADCWCPACVAIANGKATTQSVLPLTVKFDHGLACDCRACWSIRTNFVAQTTADETGHKMHCACNTCTPTRIKNWNITNKERYEAKVRAMSNARKHQAEQAGAAAGRILEAVTPTHIAECVCDVCAVRRANTKPETHPYSCTCNACVELAKDERSLAQPDAAQNGELVPGLTGEMKDRVEAELEKEQAHREAMADRDKAGVSLYQGGDV